MTRSKLWKNLFFNKYHSEICFSINIIQKSFLIHLEKLVRVACGVCAVRLLTVRASIYGAVCVVLW